MPSDLEIPSSLLGRLRSICLALPESYEEPAWMGTRWRIRQRTFAHVVVLHDDATPAFTRLLALVGPGVLVTFRLPEPERSALAQAGAPYVDAGWGRGVLGLLLDDSADWAEVAEMLTESYRFLAPQFLAARATVPGTDPP